MEAQPETGAGCGGVGGHGKWQRMAGAAGERGGERRQRSVGCGVVWSIAAAADAADAAAWPGGGGGVDYDCDAHLVNGDNVSKLHTQVLAHHLVEADLRLLAGVISKDNADSVLPLLTLEPSPQQCTAQIESRWLRWSAGQGLPCRDFPTPFSATFLRAKRLAIEGGPGNLGQGSL